MCNFWRGGPGTVSAPGASEAGAGRLPSPLLGQGRTQAMARRRRRPAQLPARHKAPVRGTPLQAATQAHRQWSCARDRPQQPSFGRAARARKGPLCWAPRLRGAPAAELRLTSMRQAVAGKTCDVISCAERNCVRSLSRRQVRHVRALCLADAGLPPPRPDGRAAQGRGPAALAFH